MTKKQEKQLWMILGVAALIAGIFFLSGKVGLFATFNLPVGCDPEGGICEASCEELFTSPSQGNWQLTDTGFGTICYADVGEPTILSYEVGSDEYCDAIFGEDGVGSCLVKGSGYCCPSYDRNGGPVGPEDCCDCGITFSGGGSDSACGQQYVIDEVQYFDFTHDFFQVSGLPSEPVLTEPTPTEVGCDPDNMLCNGCGDISPGVGDWFFQDAFDGPECGDTNTITYIRNDEVCDRLLGDNGYGPCAETSDLSQWRYPLCPSYDRLGTIVTPSDCICQQSQELSDTYVPCDEVADITGLFNFDNEFFTGGMVVELTPVCGDGTLDEGEECDDGNNVEGDGCSSLCVIEVETPPPETTPPPEEQPAPSGGGGIRYFEPTTTSGGMDNETSQQPEEEKDNTGLIILVLIVGGFIGYNKYGKKR